MNILGLKGFSNLGDISQYFNTGYFPQKQNWCRKDLLYLQERVYNKWSTERYIIICYSDGGTVGHPLFLQDINCIGIVAVHATFSKYTDKYISVLPNNRPVLIISNPKDITRMHKHAKRACNYYKYYQYPYTHTVITSNTWHGHDFEPALPIIKDWIKDKFNENLDL